MRLGIDFGTSTTVAVIAVAGREPRPLLFDGSPLLPSAVCVDATGRIVVGRDAVHLATSQPGSFEPHPKRCVDDGTVLLGAGEVGVSDMFAAVIGRVLDEAITVTGNTGLPPDDVVVTFPAAWGAERRAVLRQAAPSGALLVPEPVAAAHYFVEVAGHSLPEGGTAVVYDFGGGTFDASVVRRTTEGFEVLATRGLPDSGGLDIDAAIVTHIAAGLPGDDRRRRLDTPRSGPDRRSRQQLWDNVRTGKEMLSRATSTFIHVPLFEADVPLGREELDALAAPVLERTVEASREALDLAGVAEPTAIFLAGGSSRMPAVATVLHRAFGLAPTMVDQPELAVAEGSLRATATSDQPADTTLAKPSIALGAVPWTAPEATSQELPLVPGAPVPTADDAPDDHWPALAPIDAAARQTRSLATRALATPARRLAVTAAGVAALVAVAATGWAAAVHGKRQDPNRDGDHVAVQALSSRSSSPRPSPSSSYAPGIDPCLIGTWQVTQDRSYGLLDGVREQYVGGAGELDSYHWDGTWFTDYANMQPRTVTHRGAVWANVVRGTSSGKYFANNGEMTSTVTASTAEGTLTRNGKFNNKAPSAYYLEPVKYTCTATGLSITSEQGNFSSDSARVTPYP